MKVLAGLRRRVSAQEPPNLRRQREFRTRLVPEDSAHALLPDAVSVERRGVEEANARVPRRLERREGLDFPHLAIQTGQWRGAEAEPGDFEAGAAELDLLACPHSSKIRGSRSLLLPV